MVKGALYERPIETWRQPHRVCAVEGEPGVLIGEEVKQHDGDEIIGYGRRKDAHSGHELGEPAVFGKAAMMVPMTSPSTKLMMRATDMAKTVQGSAPAMMLTTDAPG